LGELGRRPAFTPGLELAVGGGVDQAGVADRAELAVQQAHRQVHPGPAGVSELRQQPAEQSENL